MMKMNLIVGEMGDHDESTSTYVLWAYIACYVYTNGTTVLKFSLKSLLTFPYIKQVVQLMIWEHYASPISLTHTVHAYHYLSSLFFYSIHCFVSNSTYIPVCQPVPVYKTESHYKEKHLIWTKCLWIAFVVLIFITFIFVRWALPPIAAFTFAKSIWEKNEIHS